jgi:hypothetical protein
MFSSSGVGLLVSLSCPRGLSLHLTTALGISFTRRRSMFLIMVFGF